MKKQWAPRTKPSTSCAKRFDPFFAALHDGLKQLDKTVRQHEKEQAGQAQQDGKRAVTDRKTRALKTALEELHKEVKNAEVFYQHINWLQERFLKAEYEDVTGLCKLASPAEVSSVQRLQHLHGFDCHTKDSEDLNDDSGRTNKRDVILLDRVKQAAMALNPLIPAVAIDDALERLMDRRQAMSLVAANREVYNLVRDGIPVEFDNAKGEKEQDHVRLIEFNDPDKNRYLAMSQLWVKGERGFRRPDVLVYVNGIPLVFIELKNSNLKLKTAFDDNVANYKPEIPQLFLTNAFCVLSNAIETRVGSITAEWGISSTGCGPTTRRRKSTAHRFVKRARALNA